MASEGVHAEAILGTVAELNLFEGPLVQSGVERSLFVEYRPTSQISTEDAPVHFSLGGDSSHYIDLKRTRLYVKLKLVHEDGTNVEKSEVVAPINLILHSLWSQVEVKVSGKTVSLSNNCYGYKSYIQSLLKTSDSAKTSHFRAQGWAQDGGDVDKIMGNEGAIWRYQRCAGSTSLEVEGNILEDFCQTNRYLLNNTQVDIKLFRARQPFVIMAENDSRYKLVLEDVSLKVCYVDVHAGIIAGHASALKHGNAIYPYTRVEMLTYNLTEGARQFNLDNLFNGQCPTKVIVGLVDSDSFSGDFRLNPYNFKNFSLSEIELSADGRPLPSRALRVPNFDNIGGQVVSPYLSLFDCVGGGNMSAFGNMIEPEDFARGYALYAFSLFGGGAADNFMQPKQTANVRVRGSFSSPLPNAVTAIIYAEFPSVIEIEASRNVILVN